MAEWFPASSAAGSPARQAADAAPAPARGDGETLHARLRRETRAAHERLDGSFAALGEGRSQDYGRFLQMNEACLRRIEPILSALPFSGMEGWRFEPRHAEAAADLAALALPPVVAKPFPLSRPTEAEGFGIAYVLEGSRLGGRMILRALRRTTEAHATGSLPTSFLETADRMDRFRAFFVSMEKVASTEPDRTAAVDAANTTFEYFLYTVRLANRRPATGGAN